MELLKLEFNLPQSEGQDWDPTHDSTPSVVTYTYYYSETLQVIYVT